MLGYFRYLLAVMVACSHLWSDLLWWQGIYAVFGFYVISGYLMTLVLAEVYVGREGVGAYLLNRLLRIYPLYLVVLAIAVVVRLGSPLLMPPNEEQNQVIDFVFFVIGSADSVHEWVANLTLVFYWDTILIVSQGWSLRVELVFYALMPFLVMRRWILVIWFLISIGLVAYYTLSDVSFITRYIGVMGASFAFSLGAVTYALKKRITPANWHKYLAVLLFVLHTVFAAEIWGFDRQSSGWGTLFSKGYYGLPMSTFLCAYLLWALSAVPRDDSLRSRWNDRLGDLSYAVFLCHWIVAAWLVIAGMDFSNKPLFFAIAFVIINFFAYVLNRLVERPINDNVRRRLRDRVTKPKAAQ
ncbi:MAG: acyltransferase [Pseudomonadota bacterium]